MFKYSDPRLCYVVSLTNMVGSTANRWTDGKLFYGILMIETLDNMLYCLIFQNANMLPSFKKLLAYKSWCYRHANNNVIYEFSAANINLFSALGHFFL